MVGEFLRKLTHVGAISIPIIYMLAGRGVILTLVSGAFLISLLVDLVRFFGREKNKEIIWRLFGIIIRPHEKDNFTGATYILLSSILAILIFDKPVAVLAIAFIVIGDTAGAIVGRMWGKVWFRNKTIEGSISFFAACCIIALPVTGIPLWVRFTGAFAAAIVEALTVRIDDNLTVPLISGALMQLIVNQYVGF
jgi:dolichol kinase